MKPYCIYLGSGAYLAAFPAIGKPLQRTVESFRAYRVSADEARNIAEVIPDAKPILVLDSIGWRKSARSQEAFDGR